MITKYRIISGFVFMVLIIFGVAGLSVFTIPQASRHFGEYRRLARLNVDTSDLEARLRQTTTRVSAFVHGHDTTAIEESVNRAEALTQSVSELEKQANGPQVKATCTAPKWARR